MTDPAPIRGIDVMVLAATIYGEARGTNDRDRQDVATVIMNRYRKGPAWMRSQPGDNIADFTIEAVCRDPWQFSCWNPNDPNRRLLDEIMEAPVAALGQAPFRRCMEAALFAVNGKLTDDRTQGSLHYHTVAMGWPKTWGKQKMPVYDNGFHRFYNDIE